MNYGLRHRRSGPLFDGQFRGFNSAFPQPAFCYCPAINWRADQSRGYLISSSLHATLEPTMRGLGVFPKDTLFSLAVDTGVIASDAWTIAFSWGGIPSYSGLTSTNYTLFQQTVTDNKSKILSIKYLRDRDDYQSVDFENTPDDNPTFALVANDDSMYVGAETTDRNRVVWGLGHYHTLVVTRAGIAEPTKFWLDGISLPATSYTRGSSILDLGLSRCTMGFWNVGTLLSVAWNYAIPDNGAALLSWQPDLTFAPPRRRMYFFPSGAITTGRARSYTLLIG